MFDLLCYPSAPLTLPAHHLPPPTHARSHKASDDVLALQHEVETLTARNLRLEEALEEASTNLKEHDKRQSKVAMRVLDGFKMVCNDDVAPYSIPLLVLNGLINNGKVKPSGRLNENGALHEWRGLYGAIGHEGVTKQSRVARDPLGIDEVYDELNKEVGLFKEVERKIKEAFDKAKELDDERSKAQHQLQLQQLRRSKRNKGGGNNEMSVEVTVKQRQKRQKRQEVEKEKEMVDGEGEKADDAAVAAAAADEEEGGGKGGKGKEEEEEEEEKEEARMDMDMGMGKGKELSA